MQEALNSLSSAAQSGAATPSSQTDNYQVIRRSGDVVSFAPQKIAVALTNAFLAVRGAQGAASASVRDMVNELTEGVVRALLRSRPEGGRSASHGAPSSSLPSGSITA